MKLIAEITLFVLLLCCFCCCCLTLSDTCWVECPKSQRNLSESECFLRDDGTSKTCTGDLSGYENVSVLINLTSTVLELEISLSPSNLEIGALRLHSEITYLWIGHGYALISSELFYLLPELTHLILWQVKFHLFPQFSDSNPLLTYLSIDSFSFTNPGSYNSILRKGCVSGLSQLNRLYLSSGQFLTTTDGSFSGLTALKLLYLIQFHIPNPVATFSPLVNLGQLNYEASELTDISFLSLTPSLYGLINLLFNNNNITHIPSNVFLNYTNLNELDLDYNKIFALEPDSFKGLGNLRILYLKLNKLKELSTTVFGELESLKIIDLSYNQISHLFSKTFDHIIHLTELDLTGLPLCCDCSLKWISKTYVNIYNPICATPPQWHGKYAKDTDIYVNCPPESVREGILTL